MYDYNYHGVGIRLGLSCPPRLGKGATGRKLLRASVPGTTSAEREAHGASPQERPHTLTADQRSAVPALTAHLRRHVMWDLQGHQVQGMVNEQAPSSRAPVKARRLNWRTPRLISGQCAFQETEMVSSPGIDLGRCPSLTRQEGRGELSRAETAIAIPRAPALLCATPT